MKSIVRWVVAFTIVAMVVFVASLAASGAYDFIVDAKEVVADMAAFDDPDNQMREQPKREGSNRARLRDENKASRAPGRQQKTSATSDNARPMRVTPRQFPLHIEVEIQGKLYGCTPLQDNKSRSSEKQNSTHHLAEQKNESSLLRVQEQQQEQPQGVSDDFFTTPAEFGDEVDDLRKDLEQVKQAQRQSSVEVRKQAESAGNNIVSRAQKVQSKENEMEQILREGMPGEQDAGY